MVVVAKQTLMLCGRCSEKYYNFMEIALSVKGKGFHTIAMKSSAIACIEKLHLDEMEELCLGNDRYLIHPQSRTTSLFCCYFLSVSY